MTGLNGKFLSIFCRAPFHEESGPLRFGAKIPLQFSKLFCQRLASAFGTTIAVLRDR